MEDAIQAPTPFPDNVENNDDFFDFKDVHNFKIIFNKNQNENILFNIQTGLYKNKIVIIAKENKEFIFNEYKTLLSLGNLILKNKQFKSYDSIKEAFNQILKLFEKEKIIIKEYNENEIVLEIKLSNLLGEEEIFEINLHIKKIDKDIIIKELIDKIIVLEKEIKDLKENKNLEKEIIELKKEKEKQDKEIQELKSILLINEKKNSKYKKDIPIEKSKINYIINSKIIKDNSIDFVINKIQKIYEKNIKELKLLYRGSENNFESKSFHSKCDKVKGTLTLVKNKKGLIFGGFTNESWDGNNISKKDDKAFCFSIKLKKIYEIIKEKEAIKCNVNYGPIFLNDIFGFRKYNLLEGECFSIKACYYSGCNDDYEINGGETELKVDEIEIFSIII